LGFTEGKNMHRPGFLLNLYLFKSPELISSKKWPPGPEVAVPRAIQGNRSYHGLTDQLNASNGSISNVMKFFIASGGDTPIYKDKIPKQNKLLVWLSKKASHSDQVKLKTDLQKKKMFSANATTA
jgi:hypothetical protein